MDNRHIGRELREKSASSGSRIAMRHKENDLWQEISWSDFNNQAMCVAKALIDSGFKEQDKLAIFANNRPEWTIADVGGLFARAVVATIHSPSTAAQAEYVINDAGVKVLFVGTADQFQRVLEIERNCSTLERIVVFEKGIDLKGSSRAVSFADFLAEGREADCDGEVEKRLSEAKSEDLLTIIYTSGTTGTPKGAMLDHSNIFHQFDALNVMYKTDSSEISLSFLPLSHVFERCWVYCQLMMGAQVNYCSDPKLIIDYLSEVRPTVMCSVPRIYEKIYSAVLSGVQKASPAKQKIFNWATGVGQKVYETKILQEKNIGPWLAFKFKLADALALKKIRGIFGGRPKLFPSAGAPLAKEIEEFFWMGGVQICQGYGLTETSPTLTTNTPFAYKFGTVGQALPDTDIRFSDEGEIQVKSPSVMKGYYNKKKETEEAFTGDGYFRTGDVGEFDAEGYLKITDRIKDLIITAGGKNVAPQAVEKCVGKDYYIEQMLIIGNQRKFITALIVPAFEALEGYAADNNIAFDSPEDLIKNEKIIKLFEERINENSGELAGFERIKKFTLLPGEFTVEDGEITPTNKIKRAVVEKKYADVIDSMYE